MFSSTGLFRGLPCPCFASSSCERPFCHYSHSRIGSSQDADDAAADKLGCDYAASFSPTPLAKSSGSSTSEKVSSADGYRGVYGQSSSSSSLQAPVFQTNIRSASPQNLPIAAPGPARPSGAIIRDQSVQQPQQDDAVVSVSSIIINELANTLNALNSAVSDLQKSHHATMKANASLAHDFANMKKLVSNLSKPVNALVTAAAQAPKSCALNSALPDKSGAWKKLDVGTKAKTAPSSSNSTNALQQEPQQQKNRTLKSPASADSLKVTAGDVSSSNASANKHVLDSRTVLAGPTSSLSAGSKFKPGETKRPEAGKQAAGPSKPAKVPDIMGPHKPSSTSYSSSSDMLKSRPSDKASKSKTNTSQSQGTHSVANNGSKPAKQVIADMFGLDSETEEDDSVDLTPPPPKKIKVSDNGNGVKSSITTSSGGTQRKSSPKDNPVRIIKVRTSNNTDDSTTSHSALFSSAEHSPIDDDCDRTMSAYVADEKIDFDAQTSSKKRIAYESAGSDSASARRAAVVAKTSKRAELMPAKDVMEQRRMKAREEIARQTETMSAIKRASSNSESLTGSNVQMKSTGASAGPSGRQQQPAPTVAGSAPKGVKRQARVPAEFLDILPRPIIPPEYGGKVPTSIRQGYLNKIVDECVRFCATEKEAYDRASAEERTVYEKASSKQTYTNAAVNAVRRLRDSQGLSATTFESSSASDAKLQVASVDQKRKLTVSHDDVLGGKLARKQNYTVHRTQYAVPAEDVLFCDLLKKYVLTPMQLDSLGYPRPDPDNPSYAIFIDPELNRRIIPDSATNLRCCRCGVQFDVDADGIPTAFEECLHHWGRPFKRKVAGAIETRYSCCQTLLGTEGCCIAKFHVTDAIFESALENFRQTESPLEYHPDGDYGVYALDCEMIYTTRGSQLARVTVVDQDLQVVYDTLVRPYNAVLDYNTRFSGLKESDFDHVDTRIEDVQSALLDMFCSDTILIGHSLESDLRALKLFHDTVVDTSVVFPHRLGLPNRRALKTLASDYLKKIIQNGSDGHNSQEDAATCMELMKLKVKQNKTHWP